MTIIWRNYREPSTVESVRIEPGWHGPREKPDFEAHDTATRALRRQFEELYRLEESATVVPLIEKWGWLEQMAGPADRQAFLEPLILSAQRGNGSRGELIFLLLVCEPVRRGVAGALMRVGLTPDVPRASWHRREEARRVHEIERSRLEEVTHDGLYRALYACPQPLPERFFPWLRETVAHRPLDFVRDELTEREVAGLRRVESEAMQTWIAGFEHNDSEFSATGYAASQLQSNARLLFATVKSYAEYAQVRKVCRAAIGRLPNRQQQAVQEYFMTDQETQGIAANMGVAASTVYNHAMQARRSLHADDSFYAALFGLGKVRDRARMAEIRSRYPDGTLPDGRRIVVIAA